MDRKRPSKWDVKPSQMGAGGDQKKARFDVQQPASNQGQANSGGYEGFEAGYQGLDSLYQGINSSFGDQGQGAYQKKSRGGSQNNNSNKWGQQGASFSGFGGFNDYGNYGNNYGSSYGDGSQANNYEYNNKESNYRTGHGDAYYNQGGNYDQGGNYEGKGRKNGGQWSNYGVEGSRYNGPGGDYQGQDNSYGGQRDTYGNYDGNYGSNNQWGYDSGYQGLKLNNFNKSQNSNKNDSGKSLLGKPPIQNQQKRSLVGPPPPPPLPRQQQNKQMKGTNKKKTKKPPENKTTKTPTLIASNKSANGIGYSNPYAGYDVEEEDLAPPPQPVMTMTMTKDYEWRNPYSQRRNNYSFHDINARFGQANKNRNRTPVGNKISVEQKVATMKVVPQIILTTKEQFLKKIKDMIIEKQKGTSKKPIELLSASILEQKQSMIVITVNISDYEKEGMAPYFNGRPVPIAGFVTEIRANGMSLGLSYSVTKAKTKDILGAEIVEKLTAEEGVVVKAVDRGLKDKVYKDLVAVVASKSEEVPILPCFLRAPPGTKEYHEMIAEQQIKNKERKAKLKAKTETKQPEPESPAKSESSVTLEETKVSNKEIDGDPVQCLKNMLVDSSVEIDLSKHFTPELIEYKRMFLKHLKEVMLLNKDENPAVKMNTSGQLCGESLQYIYTDLKTVSFTNYPKFFKESEAPSGSGQFCELRIRGVFITMVFATNKTLAKNKAAIEAIKLLKSQTLNVVAIARGASNNQHFPELVLSTVANTDLAAVAKSDSATVAKIDLAIEANKGLANGANSEVASLPSKSVKVGNLELVGREIPDFILPEQSKFSREDPFENLKAKKGGKNSIVVVQKKLKIKNVHVADEIPLEYLQYKESLLQKVIQNLKSWKDSTSLGEISKLSKSLGGIRDSLATIIRDVAELNKEDIKTCFDGRPVPIAGYLCEIRMNETCLGIGYHVKKHKVKESTITKINETLLTPGATIVPTIRKCMDTSYKDLVLTLTPDAKIESPMFLHPPRGTPEYHMVVKNNSKSSSAADIDYPMKDETKVGEAEPCLNDKTEKSTEDIKESSENSGSATASSGSLTTIDKYKHKFIMFTKSGGQESYTPQEAESKEEESFDPKTFYTPEYIEYKKRFIDHFVEVINQKKSECKGSNELLSKAAQICQENPKFLFTDITTVAKQNYPDIIKKRADNISAGYICEVRFQDIYLALAYSISKTGVKEKAAEAALKELTADSLHVIPMTRKWNGKKYADLVLSTSEEGRQDLPIFYSPPGSVKEEEDKTVGKVGKDGKKVGKVSTEASKEPAKEALLARNDFYHCGPFKSGKALDNFAIVMDDGVDNPTCVFNTSAQFSKMAVDYYYEKIPGWKEDQLITLFIEGIPIADARGKKRILKQKVSVQGLQCLNQFCHVVLTNKDLIDANDVVRRSDIKIFPESLPGSSSNRQRDVRGGMLPQKKSDSEKGTIGGVGESMLKNMGWREGGGIGDKFKAKTEVIKVTNDSVNREGLGAKNTNPYNITREEADAVLKKYAASSQTEELVFSSELNFDERLEIRRLAKRYNLNERLENVPFRGYKKIFLIVSKKLDSDFIINKLLTDGSYGKYQMMAAAGAAKMDKDEVIKKYLNYQKFRKEQGFPKDIDELIEKRKIEEGKGNKFNYKATTVRYSDVDKTTTFDRFGKVKTAEKAVMDKLADTKQKGFKFNQQPDGFMQQLKQWEECGWEDMMDNWQDSNMDQGWNSGNLGWNDNYDNSDWNNRNFGNWNDRNFDNPEWNDTYSGIPEWNANMDQGWNEGGGNTEWNANKNQGWNEGGGNNEWNANKNQFWNEGGGNNEWKEGGGNSEWNANMNQGWNEGGGNGNPKWNANMHQWNEGNGREWNFHNSNQQNVGERDPDKDLAQLQLRTWEIAQNSMKPTGQGDNSNNKLSGKSVSKSPVKAGSKSPGRGDSSSKSSTGAGETTNIDDLMSNVDKWIKRKVEGSNSLANDGLKLNDSASNADIDNIPMPLSNPVEGKKKGLPKPVPLMQVDTGEGSDQSLNQGWPNQSSNQGWPAQNVPRRGGGLLGQGPGASGWGNSGNSFGGFGGNTGGVAESFGGFGGKTGGGAGGFGGFGGNTGEAESFGGFGGKTGGVAGGFGGNTGEAAEGLRGFRGSRGGVGGFGGSRGVGSQSGGTKDDWSEFLKEQYEQLGDQDSSQSTEQQPPGQFSRGRGGAWNNGRGRW